MGQLKARNRKVENAKVDTKRVIIFPGNESV